MFNRYSKITYIQDKTDKLKMIAQTPLAAKKITAQEKEAMIMNEIRSNMVKYEPKFEGSFLGNIFGFSIRTTAN